MNSPPLLNIEELRKYFPVPTGFFQRTSGWIKAVDGISLSVNRGETLGLVGESGCGKSTLAKLILKLLAPDSGKIIYKDTDIAFLSERKIKPIRREIQIIFQDPQGSLNPKLSVGATLEDGLRVIGLNKEKRHKKIASLLDMVNLSFDCRKRYPHEFSGGQLQRIGLARALSVDPSLIICDEPVSALDVSIQAQMINLLKDLQERLNLSYLFISHDLNVVGYTSDQVAVMYLGEIMEYALTDQIFSNPRHPYTKALLAAAPRPEPGDRKGLQELPGEVPDLGAPPKGCKFNTRCPWAEEECRQAPIDFSVVGPGHQVRCWKHTRI